MNKQELIKNIKSLAREAGQEWPHEEVVELRDVLREISQLDEPEVLSQEWIDEHAVAVAYDGMPDQTEIVYVDELENLIIPKQEKIKASPHAEVETLYYALVKGHELVSDLFKYWNCKAYNSGHLLIGSKYPKASCINRMTKNNWNKLGIIDSNADFVKVDEKLN